MYVTGALFFAPFLWSTFFGKADDKVSNEPVLTFVTDSATQRNLSGGVERVPPMGTSEVLSKPEIRYCLSESTRLDAAAVHAKAENADHTRLIAQMRADFQGRCGSFKYKVKRGNSDLESVSKEVERLRNDLYAAGSSRFLK
jgi:hypothetical protein